MHACAVGSWFWWFENMLTLATSVFINCVCQLREVPFFLLWCINEVFQLQDKCRCGEGENFQPTGLLLSLHSLEWVCNHSHCIQSEHTGSQTPFSPASRLEVSVVVATLSPVVTVTFLMQHQSLHPQVSSLSGCCLKHDYFCLPFLKILN